MSQPSMPASETGAPMQRTSRWSIASLILGIGSLFLWIVAGVPAIVCGIVGLSSASRLGVGGRGFAIFGIAIGSVTSILGVPVILALLLLPALNAAKEAARRSSSMSNMTQQSAGLMSYQETNNAYPSAAGAANGHPVSWRTHISPYLEAGYVHDEYHFDEAWDSDANLPLSHEMPLVFKNPNLKYERTNYLALVGDETAMPPSEAVASLKASSLTIQIVEADDDRSVIWTQPRDLNFDPNNPLDGLGNFRPGVILVVFADGSTRSLSRDIDPEVFRAMVTRSADDNAAIGSTLDLDYEDFGSDDADSEAFTEE